MLFIASFVFKLIVRPFKERNSMIIQLINDIIVITVLVTTILLAETDHQITIGKSKSEKKEALDNFNNIGWIGLFIICAGFVINLFHKIGYLVYYVVLWNNNRKRQK